MLTVGFADNYHVYQDTTGFKYDVTVTKVEPRLNKNERWEMTVCEL